jgi:chromosome segregation ATPase
VLSAYFEPLLRGRRVAVFGDATIGLAEELSRRGARLVHAYDLDQARTAEAMARALPEQQYAVSYGVLSADLSARDGAFDLIMVPDLSIFPEPADLLRRARRLIGPGGAVVIVTPNLRGGARWLIPEVSPPVRGPAPPGYYELYDLVSLQFPKVRMVGQAPFVGYTVADFAPHGEPEVSVDTSFLPSSEEPEHFIAIGSDRAMTIDAYTVVALPFTQVGETLGTNPAEKAAHEEDRIALTETRTRLALMSAELEKLRDQQQTTTRDVETRAASVTALSSRVIELELALESRDGRIRELEARAGDNHVRAERLSHQIRELEEELRHQRDRATRLSKQLDDEKKSRTKAELELGMIRGVPLGSPKDRERIEALTAELETSRARITELEADQTATQRKVQIPHPSVAEPNRVAESELNRRLDELETAVNNALGDVAAANAARDGALDRLRRAEAKVDHLGDLEVALASAEHVKEALTRQNQALEAFRAEDDKRIAEIERSLGGARAKIAELEQQRAENRAKIAEIEQNITDSEQLRRERERLTAALAQREAELAEERSVAEAMTIEIAMLETALRERGHVVTALKSDLLESERIGKELLAELETSRAWNGAAPEVVRPLPLGGAADNVEDLRARLNVLAENAARNEADLQAARWRIEKLERELAEAGSPPRDPTAVQIELEAALAAARDEVAALRRAIGAV